jgi:hypothetical protein
MKNPLHKLIRPSLKWNNGIISFARDAFKDGKLTDTVWTVLPHLKRKNKRWILLERHHRKCKCSYCRQSDHWYGLKMPECKKPNAWKIFSWSTINWRWYFRWTGKRKSIFS